MSHSDRGGIDRDQAGSQGSRYALTHAGRAYGWSGVIGWKQGPAVGTTVAALLVAKLRSLASAVDPPCLRVRTGMPSRGASWRVCPKAPARGAAFGLAIAAPLHQTQPRRLHRRRLPLDQSVSRNAASTPDRLTAAPTGPPDQPSAATREPTSRRSTALTRPRSTTSRYPNRASRDGPFAAGRRVATGRFIASTPEIPSSPMPVSTTSGGGGPARARSRPLRRRLRR